MFPGEQSVAMQLTTIGLSHPQLQPGLALPEIVTSVAVRIRMVPATLHITSITCSPVLYFLPATLLYGHFGHLQPAPSTQLDTFRSTSVLSVVSQLCLAFGTDLVWFERERSRVNVKVCSLNLHHTLLATSGLSSERGLDGQIERINQKILFLSARSPSGE